MGKPDPNTITRIRGNKVTIELEDWRRFLAIVKRALPLYETHTVGELRELEDGTLERDVIPGAAVTAGAECGDCDEACARHGGCDFAFGEAPDCGYVCEDGHVVIEEV